MAQTETYGTGRGKLIVEKTDDGTRILSVKNHAGDEPETGDMTHLGLSIGPGGDPAKIQSVRNDTVIRTKTNPTCTWYFFQGKWWKVCY